MGFTKQIAVLSSFGLFVLIWNFYPFLMGAFCDYLFQRTSNFISIRITFFDIFFIGFIP